MIQATTAATGHQLASDPPAFRASATRPPANPATTAATDNPIDFQLPRGSSPAQSPLPAKSISRSNVPASV